MKKAIIVLLILPLIFLCGFRKKEKPYVILSSAMVTKENISRVERYFSVGQRVHYTIVAPDGVKYPGIRMQLSKQSDKTTNWGFSIEKSEEIFVPKSEQFYRSYFVPTSSGKYIIQFFYLNNKRYPFIHKEFFVQ